MSSSRVGRLGAGWILVALLFASGVAMGAGPDTGAAPVAGPQFKAGDTLTIAAERASLMVGSSVVATLAKGQQIVVVEVRPSWVGTYASINGQHKAGWIKTADFIPSDPVAEKGKLYTAARPIAAESAAAAESRPAAPVAVRRQHNHVAGEYNTGYYNEHGIDPNIHVWEPWRHQ